MEDLNRVTIGAKDPVPAGLGVITGSGVWVQGPCAQRTQTDGICPSTSPLVSVTSLPKGPGTSL